MKRGFVMIEIIVVVAILIIIFLLGLNINFDFYSGNTFRSERIFILSLLEKARSNAMSNINQSRGGLCYDNSMPQDPKYILFEGSDYSSASSFQKLESKKNVLISGAVFNCTSGGIVFDRLSGKLYPQISPQDSEITISVSEGSRNSNININNEGRINW